jgi:hypothetical protein
VLLGEPAIPTDEEIERRIAVRMGRQRRLLEDGDAPDYWIIVNEAALRRNVGGKAVMKEQLEYLLERSRLSNVTIQVLTFESGAHSSMNGGFTILGFPEPTDRDVVYVEYREGSIYLEQPSEVRSYTLVFDHLRAQALGRDASRSLIAKLARELDLTLGLGGADSTWTSPKSNGARARTALATADSA